MTNDVLRIADREFRSRLIVGTGKYRSFQEMVRAHEASGAEIVTVAVRRLNLTDKTKESLLDYIDRGEYFTLPNTAGWYSADEAGIVTAVPLIVDGGVGTASDAAIAMELGADAVLMNTGIALAQDALLMAEAMNHAVVAGRQAYLAGRMAKKLYASASSPLEG